MNKNLADRFLSCIDHEREQDVELTSQLLKKLPITKLVEAGYAVNKLTLENVRTGLAGKVYIELASEDGGSIDRGGVKVGDIVTVEQPKHLASKDHHKSCSGVVYRISSKQVTVTIDEQQEEDVTTLYNYPRLCLVKTTNTITYKRMESTMRKLAEIDNLSNAPRLVQLLTDDTIKLMPTTTSGQLVKFNNGMLNESQQHAVQFALQNEIAIIHGPPGTGKTYTLVELIQQLVNKGERVLVCGPSNISVDTILERLSKVIPGDKLLRIGHPARLLESNLRHSLDILSKSGDRGAIIKGIRSEIDSTIKGIKKLKRFKDRKTAWQDVKELRKELRAREQKIVSELILESQVVVATLHGSSSRELIGMYRDHDHLFDSLIIDEVSQAMEPQCWIPLISHSQSQMKRLVLAGDNKQLPPTIKTADNNKILHTLETTLFDRLVAMQGESFKCLLNVQYRMNQDIMKFSSMVMYQDKLVADKSIAGILLQDLPGVDDNDETSVPLIWYDTQGDEFPESLDDDDNAIMQSKYNENEALLVKHHVEALIDSNVSQSDIGIIAPYSAQVSLLKSLVREQYPGVEISTVDGFQGREKEVIVLTLVRSNDKFEVGFLKEERRLNVAMTRPKRQLCVIGNIEALQRSGNKYLKNWASWSEENSEIRYPDIDDLL
ncbi:similar to Saccharomyces cerevisiae YKL017C HCS1 Hexameric DNA polymerase alpha-associated DNA helicase A involved in lagging strand DNA synthesis [Maudiozyma saulgeensis]|uniref:DNA helicase n=1 Tax=Maudiozyma saulgeensis TaxID=1789683 RepID=A0A1X7QW93_9SACH|nr:similar to Saccharomyces cerevisiae YKL017C HCS1 Hexameric DNA polymerase alpha-associated DNA helicase A involved in lagging strand DNA synthesis [Kazachstania saulgeensis]